MSAFAPTLRMDVTEAQIAEFAATGLTVEDAETQISEFFREVSVTDNIRFTAERITVIETGRVLKNFQSVVAAVFEGDDDVITLILTTGDVVEMKLNRV